jgi:hypothetical protein
MDTTKQPQDQTPPTAKGRTPDGNAAPVDPVSLKTLAVTLSTLVAQKSKNPHLSAAAKFISTSLSRP